ncbi:MAG: prepilin-type N-terminal cleavage/methylation domain-containing protein [bacterium]|nr:prepilin-type N-terminal cleavage/methylation domain-containing protein [bacterium]
MIFFSPNSIFQIPNSSRSGFTLVELLVSFTLFTVIMSIVTSIFITSRRTERNIAALILVNDNTYMAIEQMARDIRDGRNFDFTDPFSEGCSGNCFGFTNRNGEKVIYDLSNNSIRRRISPVTPNSTRNLTADNVNVQSFSAISTCISPIKVTINLKVSPQGLSGVANFSNNIQTTVSTRNFAKCI